MKEGKLYMVCASEVQGFQKFPPPFPPPPPMHKATSVTGLLKFFFKEADKI